MNNTNIINVSQTDFENKVLKASENKLIVVDFWAPWCGPCKQLTPIMEKVAKENIDEFDLVKVNIDENQEIAAQLRIQSIPTVFAFKEKKIVNAFQGVISEKDFVDFIEKSIGKKLKEDLSEFYNDIEKLINSEDLEMAKDKLLNFFTENGNDPKAVSLYLECLLLNKEFEEIEEFISSLDEEMKLDQEVNKIIKKIDIVQGSQNSQPVDALLKKLNNNPKDIKLILEIAEHYFAAEKYEESLSILLENYFKDKEKIKKKFLEFFEAIGSDNEVTKIYRKKLSSLMFS